MKKLFFILCALLATCAFAKKDVAIAKFLAYIPEENQFLFKFGSSRFLCKLGEIRIIDEKDAARCYGDKKELKKFLKDEKKMVEKIIRPGQKYYVTILGKSQNVGICDIATDKKNLRLELVRAGVAVPWTDEKEAFVEATTLAREDGRGIFAPKYNDLSACVLEGKKMPKKEDK